MRKITSTRSAPRPHVAELKIHTRDILDYLNHTTCLVDSLRDAVCNRDVNPEADHNFVLIDIINDRLKEIEKAIKSA